MSILELFLVIWVPLGFFFSVILMFAGVYERLSWRLALVVSLCGPAGWLVATVCVFVAFILYPVIDWVKDEGDDDSHL